MNALPLGMTRRHLLRSSAVGFGYLALAGLSTEAAAAEASYQNPMAPKAPHFAPRAKRVICLSMRGGPSHVDTFDYKPKLNADDGKAPTTAADRNRGRKLLGSPFQFAQHGNSGLWLSELFPHLAKHADDLCLLNSMHTNVPNHPQSFLMMHTGDFRLVRPSMGAWVLYGLGTANQNLPGFVTMSPPADLGGAQNYASAFLPAVYQGTRIGSLGQPVAQARIGNLGSSHLPADLQRKQLDLAQAMNRDLLEKKPGSLELEGVIESMELAFRMQEAVPNVLDLSRETPATLQLYGVSGAAAGGKNGKNGKPAAGKGGPTNDFGTQCLMARRLVEAGVRYVEVCHGNWDQHGNLKQGLANNCQAIDQPIAALIADLKARGLFNDTLLVWTGEFGRTPTGQSANGRDHNSSGFTAWLAGGGVKGGMRYGATDDYGIAAVENRCHVHDLHATILHLLGLDHTRLTYRYGGRDFRLTDVHGNVVKEIMA